MATVDGRRVRVVRFRGIRGHVVRWVDDCSGCTEGESGARFGPFGCSECGYTGRRRRSAWVPLNAADYDRAFPPELQRNQVAA